MKWVLGVLMVVVSPCALAASASPYDAGSRAQLFVDQVLVRSSEKIAFTLHPAKKHRKGPLLVADKPWEGWRVEIYGSVLYDGHPIPVLARDVDRSWINGIAWSRNSRCVYVEAAAHGAPALRGMEALPGEVYTQEGFYLINALTGRLIRELTIDDIRRKNRKYYEYWLWREGKPGEPRKHG